MINIVKVRRSKDNTRVHRPNGQNRHDPFIGDYRNNEEKTLIVKTDLEWMSLNYRKQRAAKLSRSKRRMILIMF